jgi:CubicO group peptidase (beta-lactamase class C family)
MTKIISILALCLFSGFIFPRENNKESLNVCWKNSTPEEQGIDSESLVAMLKRIKDEELKIRGIIIVRNDRLILECYVHPYDRHVRHDVKSVSKSIISALVGIALREGMIKDLDQNVCEFFPEFITTEEPQKKEISLRNLLTMTSGLNVDENGPIMAEIMANNDLIQATLNRPMITSPGKTFTYCTLLTHTMAGILTKECGMDLLEFSRQYLFGSLGITNVYWEKDAQGLYFGGDKMWLTPMDMAKFGYLYLNKGIWEDEQTVPKDWIVESTKNQFESFDTEGYNGYGYLWWLHAGGSYHARGFGGQMISIYPEQNMVIVFTGADNDHWRQMNDTYILPAVKGNVPLPANETAGHQLKKIIHELKSPVPQTPPPLSAIAKKISSKTYILEANELDFSELTFSFEKTDHCRLVIKYTTNTLDLAVGLDTIYRSTDGVNWVIKPTGNTLALRGKWIDDSTFFIDFHEVGEPFYFNMVFQFSDDEVTASLSWKPMNWPFVLKGRWK